jgi:protein tyrosine/serine phosphatase
MLRTAGLAGVLAACIAITACGLGAADNYAPLTVWDNFAVIKDGQAYRSAQLDATTLRMVIEQYGIKTIVNLRGENLDNAWYRAEKAVAAETGIAHVDIRMSANHLPPRETLLKLYDTFTDAEGPILIHCQAGADRTGAAAAIWRMMQGDSREAAASETSVLHGHFAARHPTIDYLVSIFQPDRDWIENEYPPDR